MDKNTKNYREAEFSALPEHEKTYRPSIQINWIGHKTKWIGISPQELEKIKKILLGGRKHGKNNQ